MLKTEKDMSIYLYSKVPTFLSCTLIRHSVTYYVFLALLIIVDAFLCTCRNLFLYKLE